MAAGHYRYSAEPAASIIKALGGVRALAAALRLSPEAVSQWNRPLDKGGSSGFIGPKHRKAIVAYAKKLKLDFKKIEHELKAAKGVDVGKASKVKGDRFEYQIVAELNTAGLTAHRVPLSGAVKGYPGDIKVTTPTGDWILQCKISARANESGRTAVIRFLHDVGIGRVYAEGETYLALQQDRFLGLMRGELPEVVNMPEMKTKGGQIAQAIAGHDALVFRRDGVKTWYALVREATYPGAK